MTDDENQEAIRFRNPVKAVGFAQLWHVITLDPEISDGAYRMLAFYLMYAQQNDKCWPARDTLAGKYGKDESTITRHNQELEAAGYITRQRRFGKTSLTWIEDADRLPRLQALAEQLFEQRDQRKNEPTNSAKMSRSTAQKCAAEEEPYNKNQGTIIPAEPVNPRNLPLIILDLNELAETSYEPRSSVTGACENCTGNDISQTMDCCPHCGVPVIWENSRLWNTTFSTTPAKQLRKLTVGSNLDVDPNDELAVFVVGFWGVNGGWSSERQRADFLRSKRKYPDHYDYLWEMFKWGRGKAIPWDRVLNGIRKKANFESHLQKRHRQTDAARGDDYKLSKSEQEQVDESIREGERLHAEMVAAGGQKAWTEQLLAAKEIA